MKNIKVLGSGCSNCKTTMQLIDDIAREEGVEIELEKVEDIADIMGYGVMSTPGVVIDGNVVHAGGIPSKSAVREWLEDSSTGGCCGGDSAASGGAGGCCS